MKIEKKKLVWFFVYCALYAAALIVTILKYIRGDNDWPVGVFVIVLFIYCAIASLFPEITKKRYDE